MVEILCLGLRHFKVLKFQRQKNQNVTIELEILTLLKENVSIRIMEMVQRLPVNRKAIQGEFENFYN